MLTLTHSPFLKALGWSLLHSLWQFGIIWLIFSSFQYAGKKTSAAFKHGLALLLVSAGFLWFAAELSFLYLAYSDSKEAITSVPTIPGFLLYTIIYNGVKTFLENNLSYLSIFYLLIVAGFFIRFTRFFFYSQIIQSRGVTRMKPELRLYVQKLVQQLDIGRHVQVWISEYVDTPMVMGFIKPIILIPIACINQLSTKQLEAVLLHELAHIRRNDYLVNLYIATIEILFFFNPFARLLVKCIQQEREKSCDDWVLQFRFDPYQYASALLSLERSRSATYSLAIAAAGKNKSLLLQRVQRIMGINNSKRESGFSMMAYFLTIGLLSFIALVNPGNLVVEGLDKTFAETKILAPRIASTFERTPAGPMAETLPLKQVKVANRKIKIQIAGAAPDVEKDKQQDENIVETPVFFNPGEKELIPQMVALQSTISETQDFSIKEKEPEVPSTVAEVDYPFVPNSSYSYYITEDSNITKLKVQKEKDQVATQSHAQAQKAIEKLNWDQIARRQKLSKAAVLKLQKEIKQSFSALNWSQIYKEAADSINKVNIQVMRSSLIQEYDRLNNYKAVQKQYETIKNELQQQQEKYKKGVEIELQEIEKAVKKRKVIVYI